MMFSVETGLVERAPLNAIRFFGPDRRSARLRKKPYFLFGWNLGPWIVRVWRVE